MAIHNNIKAIILIKLIELSIKVINSKIFNYKLN